MQSERHHITIPSLRRLGINAIPQIVEGALIPAVLFLVAKHFFGLGAGIIAALLWSAGSIGYRVVAQQRIPGIVTLRAVTLSARSVLGLMTGSAFLYFFQPILGTTCMALAFLFSLVGKRPLAGRFAGDFCSLPDHVLDDRRVHGFFRRASIAWAAVGFANAAVTLWLLSTQSAATYVIVKSALSVGITVVMVAVSALWFRQSMNRHGLVVSAG